MDAGNSRSTGDKEGRSQSGQVHRTQSFTPSMVHHVVETYAVAFKPTGTVLSNHVAGGGGKLSEMFRPPGSS